MVDVPEVRVQAGGQEGCPFPLPAKRKKNADELVMQDTVHNVSKKGKHHMNVIEMLEESDGHEIVQALRRRDGCTAKTRCKMVRILVSGMIKLHGSRPPTEIKTGLAKAIVETFPFLRDSEGEGYEAFFTKSIGRHTATGYIEERLRNVRRRMPEASGRSNQKSKLRVEEEEVGESSESNTPSKDSIPEEHMNEMRRWLQHNIEPKSKVEEYTKETSRFRLHEIRKETSSFASIMGSWPRILDDPGMIEEDFSALIGQNKSDKLSKKWTKELAAQILQYCELQRSGDALGDVFQSLKTAEDPQVALQCLPLFLAPGRMRNTPGRFRNATHSEALNAFIEQQPVFEERREVIQKWFDKWTDGQKRSVIADIVERCTMAQLQYTKSLVKVQLPVERVDFTRVLPRALSLYIFSFLDPRSLCRTAQVCWYWRYLTELDQLWMPKALKLGWYLTFTPSIYETGVWKRHYLENVRSLHYLPPKDAPKQKQVTINGNQENDPKKTVTPPRKTAWSTKSKPPKPLQHKPWRANAPVATDTHRNNYLDNEDELLVARQRRMEKMEASGQRRPQSAMTPDKTGNSPIIKSSSASKTLPSTQFNAKLKRARSTSNITNESSSGRPDWAQTNAGGDASRMTANHIGGLDATVRPAPVLKPSRSTNALNRSERDPSSGPQFAAKGWKTVEYSDDESIG